MHASTIVQALPTGEIKVCSDPETGFADMVYTRSISKTGYYICTFDIKHNDDLKKKTKRYPKFTDYQKENKKDINQMKS